jgi:molybdate transport system substrate-binding protein
LAAGEAADLLILSVGAIEALDKSGLLSAGTRTPLGRTSIGVAVKKGADVPDISTPDAFKRTLLAARAIAVSDPAVGGTAALYLPQLFARIGIADALDAKLVKCSGGGDVTERVARGEADIGLTFISEMLPIEGAAVAGPLPAPYGNDTTYCAAVPVNSTARDVAAAFIAALTHRDAREAWKRAGFEPAATG